MSLLVLVIGIFVSMGLVLWLTPADWQDTADGRGCYVAMAVITAWLGVYALLIA